MPKHMIFLLTNFDESFMDIDELRPYFMSRVKPLNFIKHIFGDIFKELTSGARICLSLRIGDFTIIFKSILSGLPHFRGNDLKVGAHAHLPIRKCVAIEVWRTSYHLVHSSRWLSLNRSREQRGSDTNCKDRWTKRGGIGPFFK